MRISGAFPSEFLKAADLQGRQVTVTMERVELREVGGDAKPVLFFAGKEKGLVLNKTNSNTISDAYGDETDSWRGQPVALFEAMVDYQGRTVAAIRVRIPPRQHQQPIAAPPPPQANGTRGVDADEIPF
jgi:hypothetical protein